MATTAGTSGAVQPLGRVLLVTGPEEFLNERVVVAARAAVRQADPEAEISATDGAQLTPGTLGELSAPSLFVCAATVNCHASTLFGSMASTRSSSPSASLADPRAIASRASVRRKLVFFGKCADASSAMR